MNEKTIQTENCIPIFSDIPFIGCFFKDKNNIKRKSNLILMIKPTIIVSTANKQKQNKIITIKKAYKEIN